MIPGMIDIKEILSWIPYVLLFIFMWRGFKIVMDFFDKRENKKLIETFDHNHAVLTFHMESAYETIHKDNILVYSLDGVKPNEDEIDKISHEFVKLTLKLMGSNIFDTMVKLYGSDDTVYFVMLDYFNRRFEDDEIRASTVDSIQNGEEL